MSARTAAPMNRWHGTFARLAAVAISLVMLAGAALAQDPPTRVGRLSDVGGQVFLAPDDTDTGWQPVGLNYPVTIGDNVWVSADGRAEIDYGGGQLRLAQEANVHFTELDERVFSAFLANGRASLRLRSLDPGETAKLDTPNAQIDLLQPGTYRLDTSADSNHTTLVVREGEAEMRIGDRKIVVLAGQTASVQGAGYGAAMSVRDGIGTDGFDQYALDRDARIETQGPSDQYVSSEVPGVADLNMYGQWDTSPSYGAVWYPTSVSSSWVPYQDGSWTYVAPWGWTWVDAAPWGWVPFHYGRWVRIGSRWAWTPGEYSRRPVYAPALVAWYGGASGTGWSAGYGRPTFGWVPLSWGEPYWPQYRYSNDYWRRQNQYVAVDVRRLPPRQPQRFSYANARIPGAVAAAPAEVLSNRRPVRPNQFTVSPQQIAAAPVTTAPLALRPAVRPETIGKMPARAPETAASFAARVRPDLRIAPQGGAGRPGEAAGSPGRAGVGGIPYSGGVAATPLPGGAGRTPEPQGSGGRGGVGGTPYTGQPSPTSPAQSIQPMQPVQPMQPSRPGMPQPQVQQPGPGVAGQVYGPNGRPQRGQMQPQGSVPSTQQYQATPQPMPAQPAQQAAPQPMPAQPSIQPIPQPSATQPLPVQPSRPQRGREPQQMPQVAPQPMQSAPAVQQAPAQPVYVPQQPRPMPRMPAPQPVAPAPQSIAPAPAPMAPAPASIAPAPGPVGVPQQPQQPRQVHPQGRPVEGVPAQPVPAAPR